MNPRAASRQTAGWPRRLATLALQALLALALIELALRALTPRWEPLRQLLYLPGIETDYDRHETLQELLETTLLGWQPGRTHYGFVHNSRGLRTREYSVDKPAGTYRIVALGDSFTFASGGLPYSLGWPHLLEERLSRARAEVLNFGVPGVGLLFERRLWQLEGSRLDADLAIVAFFVGNDFTDDMHLPFGQDLPTDLARHSYLARWVRNFFLLRRAEVDPGAGAAPSFEEAKNDDRAGFEREAYLESFEAERPRISKDDLIRILAERFWQCDLSEREAFEPFARKVERVLETFYYEVSASGTAMVVVIIPERFQVEAETRRAILERLDRVEEDFDCGYLQKRLGDFLAEQGIPHLDLSPAFRAAESEGSVLYNPGDTHWSPAGNALAAREIAEYLEHRGF